KQRQEITDFSAEVEGERIQVDEAKPFKDIKVKFMLEGIIDPAKALRAAELSFQKYCSVSKTLEPNVTVTYEVTVNGEAVQKLLTSGKFSFWCARRLQELCYCSGPAGLM